MKRFPLYDNMLSSYTYNMLTCYHINKGNHMKTLAIISQKGGSGKTTIAVHLAFCAVLSGKSVALIDIDQQGSTIDWFKTRKTEHDLAAIHTTAAALTDLILKAKKGGADLVIIDTAPHSAEDAVIAARSADLILIPCHPSRFDLKAMPPTFEIVKLVGTKAFIVLNRCTGQKIAENAKEALESQGFPVLDIFIFDRAAYRHAVMDGRSVHEYEPGGKAALEIDQLFAFIKGKIKL